MIPTNSKQYKKGIGDMNSLTNEEVEIKSKGKVGTVEVIWKKVQQK